VVFGLLAGIDPGSVTVETSQQLADIRAAISGELGAHGRATVLGILATSALLVAANLLGLVVMRRKDFGRRRAPPRAPRPVGSDTVASRSRLAETCLPTDAQSRESAGGVVPVMSSWLTQVPFLARLTMR
jgi:hypothetical protein